MMTSLSLRAPALRPTVQSMSWLPLLGAAAIAGVAMWLIDPAGDEVAALTALRLTAFLLAAGAAFALDDPAATTLASSPTALSVRRWHHLMPLGLAWAALWAVALATANALGGDGGISVAAPTLEAAGMLTLALAVAAIAMPYVPEGRGGIVAGPALTLAMLGALVAQTLHPGLATLFPLSPTASEWGASHARWALLLVASTVAIVIASLDPARRSPGATVIGRMLDARRTSSTFTR